MSREWSVVPLKEVLHKSADVINVEAEQIYKQVTVKLWGQGVVLRCLTNGSTIASSRQFRVHSGQFIVSRIDARNGAFGFIPPSLDGAIVTNDFPVFDLDIERVNSAYLRWLSRTNAFVDICKAASEGTTNRVRLKEERFLATGIPLPPLSEQQLIVERVEKLATKIDEAQSLRQLINEDTKSFFRQSSEQLFQSDWPSKTIASLLREDTQNGMGAKPSDSPPGTPILRISAATSMANHVVNEGDHKFLTISDNEQEKFTLQHNDLLACRFNGNLHYVGKFALYLGSSGLNQVYPDKLIRFRVDELKADPAFVCYAMNASSSREQIEAFCATTAGNIGISASNLKTIKIPVPPLDEQKRIVERQQALYRQASRIKVLQEQSQSELEALLPALLDKTFEGLI